jgi:hypothetical protein
MSLFHHLRRVFHRLTVLQRITSELAEAEIAEMEAATAKDYATAILSYRQTQIARLRSRLASEAARVEAITNNSQGAAT